MNTDSAGKAGNNKDRNIFKRFFVRIAEFFAQFLKPLQVWKKDLLKKYPELDLHHLANDPEWAGEERPKNFIHLILWTALVFVIIGLVWAHFAIIDEVSVGEGKVIASSQVQVIQNLEGGIVKNLYVKEGDIVQKGQVLVQLDPTRFESSYQEGLAKEAALRLKIERLSAEQTDSDFLPSADLINSSPDLVKQERALFISRRNELSQLEESRNLMQNEVDLTAPLVNQGAASRVEVLQLQRSLSDLQGKIDSFNSDTLNQLTQAKGDLGALEKSNLADLDRLQRTTIRSPMKGIVKQIKVTTIGGVTEPGMDMMEIVPLEDTLLIEAKIKPSDIGFIRIGLPAKVKITAYDFSIYGGLDGVVEQISADSIVDDKDPKQQSYYLVRVRTQKNYLGTAAKPLYIMPGMVASVDILTGHHSVLHYLLKPIIKAKENALRER